MKYLEKHIFKNPQHNCVKPIMYKQSCNANVKIEDARLLGRFPLEASGKPTLGRCCHQDVASDPLNWCTHGVASTSGSRVQFMTVFFVGSTCAEM